MKRIVAIGFLFLLLLQAVPVLHFFSSQPAAFYSLADEEKPVEKSGLEKKDCGEALALAFAPPAPDVVRRSVFHPYLLRRYASPTLDSLTPPPNA